MIIAIIIMIALTTAVAAFWLVPRLGPRRVVYDVVADGPRPFGYEMAWLAIRSEDSNAVLEALGMHDSAVVSSWNSGIGTIYDERLGRSRVFVSPPVKGWTFVVGLALPHPVGRSFADKCTPLLQGLGARFDDVQYFFSYPILDFYAWARISGGQLVRAFAVGDEGVIWNKGRPTREEMSLGLKLFELRGVRGRKGDAGEEIVLYPTEDHVMLLAGRWSLDPTQLAREMTQPDLGFVAPVPAAWRPERLRKSA